MTGETGTTKIDIITLTGLTLADGSILDAGAVMKFTTEFPIGLDGYRFDISPYRSIEIYKAGYKPVEIMDFNIAGEILVDNMVDVNIMGIYHSVNNFINSQYPNAVSEVVIYVEE